MTEKSAARKRRFTQTFQSDLGRPVPPRKNISLVPSGKSALPARPVLSRQEGRIAIVTNAGWDVVDATASARKVTAGQTSCERSAARRTNDADAYGKTVWS